MPLRNNETIAILTNTSSSHSIEEAEQCLREAIQEIRPNTKILSSTDFRHSVFSYRVPEENHARSQYMQSLMNHPILKERIAAMGIRLVFLLDSETTQGPSKGQTNPLPGGTFAMGRSQKRTSAIRVTAFEFGQTGHAGELGVAATGETGFAGVAPFFLAGLAFTETRVCNELAIAISQFLAGTEHRNLQ